MGRNKRGRQGRTIGAERENSEREGEMEGRRDEGKERWREGEKDGQRERQSGVIGRD